MSEHAMAKVYYQNNCKLASLSWSQKSICHSTSCNSSSCFRHCLDTTASDTSHSDSFLLQFSTWFLQCLNLPWLMLAERVKRMEKMQTSESTSNWSCVSIRLTSLIDVNGFGDGPTPLSTRPPGKRELVDKDFASSTGAIAAPMFAAVPGENSELLGTTRSWHWKQ